MKDGHVHTQYCPHGSKDNVDDYLEKALKLGYTEITFAEHAPLPGGFTDPTPLKDSAMMLRDLDDYFRTIEKAKNEYKGKIKINAGLEVDFIEGYEKETTAFLNEYGGHIDDAVLSVHFLRNPDGGYDCIDYSPESFGAMIESYGSLEAVHHMYYRTVLKSVLADLGTYKPKRIGHITLANKFQLKYPTGKRFEEEIDVILQNIADKGYELDYNGAGTAKPLCREPYPPDWVISKANALGIPLVYGSDAHQAKELGQGLGNMQLSISLP
jgi:histidinol-phosphatase (PHP family)